MSHLQQAFRERNADPVLSQYFKKLLETMETNPSSIRMDELPHARIKRIMKQDACDPHPRMISADAVPFIAFASQCFIGAITKLAWEESTQKNKRNTLQVKDLKTAVHASSRFDFLIDVLDQFDAEADAKKDAKFEKECQARLAEYTRAEHIIYDEQPFPIHRDEQPFLIPAHEDAYYP